MRILLITNHDLGLYRFRYEVVEALSHQNEIFLSLPEGPNIQPFIDMGCQFFPISLDRRGTNPFKDVLLFLNYLRLIRKIKPELVLSYTVKPNLYGGLACRISRVPFFPNITGLGRALQNHGAVSKLIKLLYRVALKNAHCVFFQNQSNVETLSHFLNNTIKRRLLPGSGVNLAQFAPYPYPDIENGIRFLFIGRVMRDKGICELIHSMERLKLTYPNIILSVLGSCEEDYRTLLYEAHGKGLLNYHGHTDDVISFIRACHCLILPSYHEGMANVLLEAAASARPVIASLIPGCQEAFDNGISGLGCEPRDTESLFMAMEAFMRMSQEQRKQMGLHGRLKMQKEFDRRYVIAAYLEEIQEVKRGQER